MPALLHALMHLARLRWLGAAFCALAMLCVTTHASALAGATAHARIDVNASSDIAATASASEVAQPQDRVWGFEQNSPLHVRSLRSASLEQPTGISPTQRETASVSSYAARGAPGTYTPNRTLPTDKQGVPIPDVNARHSQLGRSKPKSGSEPQAREWDYGSNGQLQPKRDIDFTDHGTPDIHPNPHQHQYTPNNPKIAPKGGFQRGSQEPL